MNQRKDSGATLAFVATSIVVVILIALAFYFLTQLIGGGRELQHATDSGSLNVAKQATVTPAVPLPAGGSSNISDMKVVLSSVEDKSGKVDLLTFNRMVGEAMLIAMNAEADTGSQALTNARSFIDLVESANAASGVQSIGSTLNGALSNPLYPDANNQPWAKTAFESTGMGNSLRMLGNNTQVNWQATDFTPLYYGQQPTDPSQTNVAVDSLAINLPFKNVLALAPNFDPAALQASRVSFPNNGTTAQSGKTFMRGYVPMNFAGVGRNLYAVPLDTSPHLLSMSQVQPNTVKPGISDPLGSTALPPNGWVNGALGMDSRKSHQNVHMLAAAVSGTNQQPFPLTLKYDYIVVDNAGTGASTPIPNPNLDNVFAQELMSGITVDKSSGYFSDYTDSNNKNQVQDWEETPRYQQDGKTPYPGQNGQPYDAKGNPFDPANGPPADHIFDQNGNPLPKGTEQSMASKNIPFDPTGSVVCNDTNSDKGSAGAIQQCVNDAQPPAGPGSDIFDQAYHPNSNNNNGGGGSGGYLTAAEQTCGKAMQYWQEATDGTISLPNYQNFSSGGLSTGLRLYPASNNPIQGAEAPWGPPGQKFNQAGGNGYSQPQTCQITTDGTIAQLIDQTEGRTPDPASNALSNQAQTAVLMIKQRMTEITGDPTLAANEYDNVVKKHKIPLGQKLFIYLDPAQGLQHFTISATPPPWFAAGSVANRATNPDGTPVQVASAQYGIVGTMADPAHQWNIHARPMLTINGDTVGEGAIDPSSPANNTASATDTVNLRPSSGAFGNLLNITFMETTQGQAQLQDRN